MLTDSLDAIETALSQALTQLDIVHRASLCGPQLMLLYGELRQSTRDYITLQRTSAQSIEMFVHASIQQFNQCPHVYTAMYSRVYQALDRSKRPAGIKQSGIPLDPQSALNVVECGPTVRIELHNDNETLLKFPPSSLYRVPDIEPVVHAVESFYDKQCAAVHVDYAGKLRDIRAQVAEEVRLTSDVGNLLSQIELALGQLPEWGKDARLGDLLQQTRRINGLSEINHALGEQRENCETYLHNVHAKFMVATQLRDNMLRPYDLTRLHQQSETMGSIF
jgi:hypothetical protein